MILPLFPKVLSAVVRAFLIAVLLFGCAGRDKFATAPNLFSIPGVYPDQNIPKEQRSTRARIYYVTDRVANGGSETGQEYGHERSPFMVMGRVTATFGKNVSWEQLKAVSAGKNTSAKVKLGLKDAQELVRFEPTPFPFVVNDGLVTILPQVRKRYDAERALFKREIAAELNQANRHEVVLYVHGFANSFDQAGMTAATIWHYSGRIGVPIFYSWPGKNPGLFGYFRDSESANFSVYHLKQFLLMLSEVPGLKKIHLIAHSMGAEIATTALRELIIAERAAGRNPLHTLKIENVILAAPDLDFSVVTQRLIAEQFAAAFKTVTVFMNPSDSALGLAQKLAAGRRLGRLSPKDLSLFEQTELSKLKNVTFVDVEKVEGKLGHSYFRKNPDVLSDVIRIIQSSAPPGSELRPLIHVSGNFWQMHSGYPFNRPPVELSAKEVIR